MRRAREHPDRPLGGETMTSEVVAIAGRKGGRDRADTPGSPASGARTILEGPRLKAEGPYGRQAWISGGAMARLAESTTEDG